MQLILPTLRADVTLSQTYSYICEPPLDCPITAFGGSLDRSVSLESLSFWRDQTRSAFTVSQLEGDHFFLHSSKTELLKQISAVIAQEGC